MKRFPVLLTVIAAIAMVAFLSGSATAENAYVGADGCKMCHKKADKGNQYGAWAESKHSKAYETLASDKAKEFGSARGIANPQEAPECLKCHVTAYGVDASLLDKKYKIEDGVGCESCHGAGKEYKKIKVMKDRAQAIAAGLVIPTEETCTKCHNEESPAYKPFDFEEKKAQIAHPNPSK